ncbi:hypothetical protein [Salinicola sp. CPA57]|uniref:hypothetical protein n=1 Tax=Salinicola sp. CPA57 TaxID=1949080 RepID=UPI000DA13C17|nr:hypothetical protein [Salinicola sp. CPA57]
MKTVKVMSIIGMVFFPLCLLIVLACLESDLEAAAGWGMFATFYGIGFAITAFVQANKRVKAGVE